jgi:hypothetical protein
LTGALKVWVSGAGIDFSLHHIEVDSGGHVAPHSDPKGAFFLEEKHPKYEVKNHLYLLLFVRMLGYVPPLSHTHSWPTD